MCSGGANSSAGRVQKNGTTYALATSGKPPYVKKEWITPGTYTFTVPQGITTLRCNIVGGGGGGGGGISIYVTAKSGYGGNSGEYVKNHLMSVLPNATITIVVGTGGKSYGNSNGQDGTSSSVGNLVCNGGKGGIGASANSPTNGKDSPFGKGGAAGNDTHNNGYYGVKGSGGGGAYAPISFNTNSSPAGGYGGNGYISIEYGGNI